VELKQGMAVVLLANLNIKVGLVNGAQGVIQGFEKYNPDKMPKAGIEFMGQYSGYREEEVQSFIDQAECKEWPVVRFNNGLCRTIFADCTVNEYGDRDITPYTLLSRTQIPLMPGYAITTHKSQVWQAISRLKDGPMLT
jgi:ATP-dependent DNA helicase PIF1